MWSWACKAYMHDSTILQILVLGICQQGSLYMNKKASYRNKLCRKRDTEAKQASSDRSDGHKGCVPLQGHEATGQGLVHYMSELWYIFAHRFQCIRWQSIYVGLGKSIRVSLGLKNSHHCWAHRGNGHMHVMAASRSKGAADQKQVPHWACIGSDVAPKSSRYLWKVAAVYSCVKTPVKFALNDSGHKSSAPGSRGISEDSTEASWIF